MDFEFKLEGEAGRRQSHRERVQGLVIHIEGLAEPLVVHDVSSSGLAVVDPKGVLVREWVCRVVLAIGERALARGLPAKVVREADPAGRIAGLAFVDLGPRQEAWLDKLVLEIQKRRIALRKARDASDNL